MKSFAKIMVLFVISMTSAYALDEAGEEAGEEAGDAVNSVVFAQNKYDIQIAPLVIRKDLLDCNQGNNIFNTQGMINSWAETNQLVSKVYTCDNKKFNFIRFTPDACTAAINCRKNVAEMHGSNSDKLMNEIVAKDYAKNILDQNIETMDRLEVLKRFAKSKYNINGDKCDSRYQSPKQSNTCNLNLLDEVFINQQESCQYGDGCFKKENPTTLAFKDYKEKNIIPNLSFIVDYNEYRVEQKVKEMIEQDDEFVNGLATFIMSDMFRFLSAEEKAEMVLKKLESGTGDRYKDPILAFDFDSVSEKEKLKKTMKYKQFLKTFERPDITPDLFKEAFNSFRQKRAENILLDTATCSTTMNLKKVCEEMTTLSKGDKLFKNSLVVEHVSSRNLGKEKDYEKFKSFMGGALTKMDYDVLINAKRCLSFGLASEDFSNVGVVFVDSWYKSHSSSWKNNEIVGPNENIVDSSRNELASSFVGEKAKTETVKMLDPREAESDSGVDNSISSALSNTQTGANNFGTQFNQAFTPGSYGIDTDNKAEKVEKKEEAATIVTTPAVTAPTDPKMTDLMKRLASAEDKVDKMKAANEDAENEKIKQKKIKEENLLINELKGQIADLKVQKDKKEVEKEMAIVRPVAEQQKNQSNSFTSAFNNGIVSAPARQETAPKATDNFDSGRSAGPAPSAASSNSRSISSAMLTSTTNSEGNRVLPSGLVLTTVDGMSSEKVTQTISNKIIELNGTPFYIEEGGMVKEIIAVVKDGKVLLDDKGNPIYEKIVKGKVGDKKFAKTKDKKRTPAAITDAADLKRDQEEKLKRERAEYLKLKNLTNGIIKNK